MPNYKEFQANEVVTNKNMKEKLIEFYIQSLKKEQLPWTKGWTVERHFNPITHIQYHGSNLVTLNFISALKEYKDPRWCTFKQCQDNGWKIKKKPDDIAQSGEVYGVELKYWMPALKDENGKFKPTTWAKYNELIQKQEIKSSDAKICSKSFYVYNAEHIEGIPEYQPDMKDVSINTSPFIDNLIKNMGVSYKEVGIDKAYYSPLEDMVCVPTKESFKSEYDYHSVRLHELCHATGHSSRLDRAIYNEFGSKEYAKEELRAEIASSFLSQDIGLPISQQHIENHAAYIQSWISVLENDPDELMRAIKAADSIESYALEKGEWERLMDKLIEENEFGNESIQFEEYEGTWHKIDSYEYEGNVYYLMENHEYAEGYPFLIVDDNLEIITETYESLEIGLEDHMLNQQNKNVEHSR